MTADRDPTVELTSLREIDDDEYERVLEARARVDGPEGPRVLRRRYEALPRHDDVVDRTAANVDDAMLDRPDAVHVYTRIYEDASEENGASAASGENGADGSDAADDGAGDYVADAHETWRPDDPAALADPEAYRSAVRSHLRATAGAAYERAVPDG